MKIRILCCIMMFGVHSFTQTFAMNNQEIGSPVIKEHLIKALRANNVKYLQQFNALAQDVPLLNKRAFWCDVQNAWREATQAGIQNNATEMLGEAIDQSGQF